MAAALGVIVISFVAGLAIGGLVGYLTGRKDGRDEEAKKWRQEGEWEKKEGVSFR